MRVLHEIAADVAADLEGQCLKGIDDFVDALPEEERALALAQELSFVTEIDQRVFLCDGCGWWCGTEELHNETSRDLCEDCAEDESDDE